VVTGCYRGTCLLRDRDAVLTTENDGVGCSTFDVRATAAAKP